MKRLIVVLIVVVALVAMGVAPAFAAPGGAPAAHGLTGAEFGAAVSAMARSAPGAVAAHVSAHSH